MLRRCADLKFLIASLTSVTLFAVSAFAQSPATQPANQQKEVAASESKPVKAETGVVVAQPRPNDLQSEVANLKAENAAVRELLRKMEEQQKALLEQFDRLQRRLDSPATAGVQSAVQPQATDATTPLTTATNEPPATNTENAPAPVSAPKPPDDDERYRDGIVIWETKEDATVPFLLKFTNTTQVRYLNTLSSVDTFTDHLGVVREVHKRNDITVNRSMFVFNGYIFDKRARYNLTVWTSAGAASIVVAGNIGWQFNKGLTITGGYTGVPGSRSLVNTFPFFTSTDRTLADNFFRPSFTQGIWANGEPLKNVHYLAFVGNGLNTLNIAATKIDTNLLLSGSVWWEPLGPYGPP
ncbi:MAG TPA: hypothetical protein VJP89_03385, partial [Pyrinomonadaceae bacterium]|nr:hypothetical protein [Pyrinomonadaceae bacterium]